jgi:myo-inositol-1(or 4)-monophosphatase
MEHFTDSELLEIYAFAVQLGKDAGDMLMQAAKSRFSDTAESGVQEFTLKENAVDLVTKTDQGMSHRNMLALSENGCGN